MEDLNEGFDLGELDREDRWVGSEAVDRIEAEGV